MNIKTLRNYYKKVAGDKDDVFEVMYANFDDLLDKVEQLQAELDKHRWIPVRERLPEEHEDIVVCYKHHFNQQSFPNMPDALRIIDTSYYKDRFELEEEVTHWKPIILPE